MARYVIVDYQICAAFLPFQTCDPAPVSIAANPRVKGMVAAVVVLLVMNFDQKEVQASRLTISLHPENGVSSN
jgi:hypothetical protein